LLTRLRCFIRKESRRRRRRRGKERGLSLFTSFEGAGVAVDGIHRTSNRVLIASVFTGYLTSPIVDRRSDFSLKIDCGNAIYRVISHRTLKAEKHTHWLVSTSEPINQYSQSKSKMGNGSGMANETERSSRSSDPSAGGRGPSAGEGSRSSGPGRGSPGDGAATRRALNDN